MILIEVIGLDDQVIPYSLLLQNGTIRIKSIELNAMLFTTVYSDTNERYIDSETVIKNTLDLISEDPEYYDDKELSLILVRYLIFLKDLKKQGLRFSRRVK